jgi:hypothetical protein
VIALQEGSSGEAGCRQADGLPDLVAAGWAESHASFRAADRLLRPACFVPNREESSV